MPSSSRRVRIAPDDPYKALGKSTLVFFAGSFASRALSFLLLPLFTPHLLPAVYGTIDIVTTTLLIAIPLLSLNAAEALFRFSMDSRTTEAFGTTSVLIGAGAVLVFSGGALLVTLPWFPPVRLTVILVFAGMLFTGMLKNLARAERRLTVYALSDVVYALTFVATGWYLVAVRDGGLLGWLRAQAVSVGVELLFIRLAGVGFRFSLPNVARAGKALKPLLAYALPLIPNSLSWWIVFASGRYIISVTLGMAATGLFAVAYKIPSVLATAQGVFYQAWQIESIDRYGHRSAGAFYTGTFNVFVCANFAGVLLLAPFLAALIRAFTAPAYWSAWQYAPLLVMATVFSAFASFFGVGYLATKKTAGALWTSAIGAGTNLALNVLLIPLVGMQAAGASMLAANLVTWLLRARQFRSSLGIRIRWGRIGLGTGLSAVSFAAAYAAGPAALFSSTTGTLLVAGQALCLAAWVAACRRELSYALRWGLALVSGFRKARGGR